jgi:16S rRNA C1402 N4-methylase RsmH
MALLALANKATLIGIDVDEHMMNTAKERLKEVNNRVHYVRGNYADIQEIL